VLRLIETDNESQLLSEIKDLTKKNDILECELEILKDALKDIKDIISGHI